MLIKLIVGLQNPGLAYVHTRHNAGAWFLDALADRYHLSFKTNKKLLGEVAELAHENVRCFILLPTTFMNHSGQSVRAFCDFYRIESKEILVVHDDLDISVGRAKLKTGGGHGGHNGLRDIIAHLNTTEFHRLRLGIGHPGHREEVLNYVLGKPSPEDREQILIAIARALEVIPVILDGHIERAMTQLN